MYYTVRRLIFEKISTILWNFENIYPGNVLIENLSLLEADFRWSAKFYTLENELPYGILFAIIDTVLCSSLMIIYLV